MHKFEVELHYCILAYKNVQIYKITLRIKFHSNNTAVFNHLGKSFVFSNVERAVLECFRTHFFCVLRLQNYYGTQNEIEARYVFRAPNFKLMR
jgi:hypothetical protein